MGLIFISALVIAGLTFLIFWSMLRPSPEQQALDKRMSGIKETGVDGTTREEVKQILKVQREGKFGWLEDLMDSSGLYRSIELLVLQADSKISVGGIVVASVAIGIFAGFVVFVFSTMLYLSLGVAVAAGMLPMFFLKMRRNRRVNKFNAALADSIDMMARSLRAGHSMIAAINIIAEQAVQPAAYEFGEVYKKQNYGLPLRDSLMQMLDRVPSQDLRVFVTGILVQKDTGGNLAEILDRIVFVIRERIRIQGEIRTHTAQGRLTGWILTALPVVLLLIINIVDPGYSGVLFNDPVGRDIMYVGIVLLLIGGLIIRSIINGIEI